MFDKKKLFMVNKLTIAIIILIILLAIFPIVYSKFVSKTDGSSKVGTAFYILKSDYFEANIELGKIVPRDEAYIYPFTVSNNDGENRLETKMQYDHCCLSGYIHENNHPHRLQIEYTQSA